MAARYAKTQELLYELKVSDVMNESVITVRPEAGMSELREILRDHRISGAPVVDGGRLVGIISIEDLIRWLSQGGQEARIAEKMTSRVETVFADQPVAHAIRLLEGTRGFGRFPVLDRQTGALCGIITKGDIIEGVLLKLEEEYKEEEIRRYRASHIFEDIGADEKEIHLCYRVVGKDFDRAGTASTQMKRNLKRLGLDPQVIRRLAIASYEAEMNVVIYADRGWMRFGIKPEEVTLEVDDEGPGIEDIEQAMQPGFSTSPDWVKELGFGAGMGLCNIRNCSDSMRLESTPGKGTRLRIRIDTRRDHEPEKTD